MFFVSRSMTPFYCIECCNCFCLIVAFTLCWDWESHNEMIHVFLRTPPTYMSSQTRVFGHAISSCNLNLGMKLIFEHAISSLLKFQILKKVWFENFIYKNWHTSYSCNISRYIFFFREYYRNDEVFMEYKHDDIITNDLTNKCLNKYSRLQLCLVFYYWTKFAR